ncbi:T9SS type A sorting domain-containing protein [candidate division WOR-3 bacterium]|uniref:T9SS type A sorting domain-containing protein n=1 Tax=candidate division WOR-3 bacterium TaxID=2052148 RepID=A0A938BQJ1_UNCW3|nr:T9SS type A sorting domain-containing protein [candidate division WOR-3 bacterium]
MSRTVLVLILSAIMSAAAGFTGTATTATPTASGSAAQPAQRPTPLPAMQTQGTANTCLPVIRWDKFYDRNGNPLPVDPQENVGADSLYFKNYYSLTALLGSPKSEVPNPTPESCRPAFAWQDAQPVACMDPQGVYCYEVFNTTLRRTNTNTGAYADYTIPRGESACGTDGQYLYVPVNDTVYKYTPTGALVTITTIDISPAYYEFSVVNDTVWCHDGLSTVLNGYACSKFSGGSLTKDAAWDVGTGSHSPAQVAWDGEYYYVSWAGYSSNTFKRFNADRTLSASGTISIDTRGVMCSVRGTRPVTQDSLYWKLYSSTADFYSSGKAQDVTAAQPTPLAWQYDQSVSCMTPDGHYVFEVSGTNLRRTDLLSGDVENYTLANTSGGTCGTDGQYVYVPNGTTTRKYTLNGTLVSSTTTDYAPAVGASTFCYGVANDTVWISPTLSGATWYGYACAKFTGGSITHDATWSTGGVQSSAMAVTFDGQYYYMAWGGLGSNTFKRFYRDRTLYSDGTVTGDARSVMCKQGGYPVMICHAEGSWDVVDSLRRILLDSCGGRFAALDTYNIGAGGHAAFPAGDWYRFGYRAILTWTNSQPADSAALGDSLARFVELGGGVVEAVFADYGPSFVITGDWRDYYAPFTDQANSYTPDALGTVHQPLHPVMSAISALSVANYVTGNTHNTLRSPNSLCLAEYTSSNRCLAACFDSAGRRAVSVGMYPLSAWSGGAYGQWSRLLVNALNWAAVGPSVGVTAPNGGESWIVGSAHNITWTQTPSGVKDSIYYSTDAGASWVGVAFYDPPPVPLQHTWTIPNTPTTQARVKVVTWDAEGGRVEDMSNANFTIEPFVGIAQPENNALPLTFALYRPFPNPLASGAGIRYALPRPARVELNVYDVAGTLVRRLVDGARPAGYHSVHWNGGDERGRNVAAGVYYCRFSAGGFLATQKLVVRR